MLKKAGIVFAASAASLVAMGPLAFAGDYTGDPGQGKQDPGHGKQDPGHDKQDPGHGDSHDDGPAGNIDKSAKGAIALLNGNNVNVPIQVCNNTVPVNVLGGQAPLQDLGLGNGVTGALGIAGEGKAESGDSKTDASGSCGQESGAGDTNK
ncbi:hypothetical protein [Pseudonocardia phyllosphaerae]|uniref:hypothetical protein n=1 Tax=Pseudonocardia phyllosphaerae TaxID=3390502 RepID=UPI00397DD0A4